MSMNQNCMNRGQLLQEIDRVSFAVNDLNLYLDSHPYDQKALACFREHSARRNELLKLYASQYGPLTIDTANDSACSSWDWICQPWPWESPCASHKGGVR